MLAHGGVFHKTLELSTPCFCILYFSVTVRSELHPRPLVTLAYDGGLVDHREVVLPILDRLGLRGTFCMPPEAILESPVAWQGAAQSGHEVGCHSLYGVTLDGALENWDLEMVHGDLELARRLVCEMLSCEARTFVFPGTQTNCADGDYSRVVREIFATARRQVQGLNEPDQDPHALAQRATFGMSGPELIRAVEEACSEEKWLILNFEGVGTGQRGCDAAAHAELCLWLSKATEIVSVRTVSEAADEYLRVAQATLA